ncbi:hypothetical protein H6F42_14655 [Pseudanabaena sp. FACHB-1998]|uniref:hypothetical protein n=1 Tax=Pseudanabaena sp. FACHB-1998 TaxID=2692858 RepID=UPI0016817774|nr:hypothetical protein [Pseudanabaena sp. FACHB-1998]MBD2178158.1 hypothetical protein [Pseudanabaena sp. FACHB-1998]
MALVLSNQENMDLLLLLVKIAIAVGAIAIFLLLWFWLRLKKLEKRLYLNRQQLRTQVTPNRLLRLPVASKPIPKRLANSSTKLIISRQAFPVTQVHRPKTSVTSFKKFHKSHNLHGRSRWILAILLASITGMAIAIMQLGNSFISPELMPLVWVLIGLMLLASATFAEIA